MKLYASKLNFETNTLEDSSDAIKVKLEANAGLTSTASGIKIEAEKVTNGMLAGSIASSKLADQAKFGMLDEAETLLAVWDFSTFTPQCSGVPDSANDLVNYSYVNGLIWGLDPKKSARCATTAALAACTYDNGTLGVGATLTCDTNVLLGAHDGITPIVGEIILVKDQAAGLQDGLYVVTDVGDVGVSPWILTRQTDMDEADEIAGAYMGVNEGTTLGDTMWRCETNNPVTMGTTSIDMVPMPCSIIAGNGMTKTGLTLNAINATNGGLAMNANDMNLDLNDLAAAAVDVSADSIAILDATDASSKKESISDLITAVAGTNATSGLSATSGVLRLNIPGLTASGALAATDTIAIDDGANKEATLTKLGTLLASGTNSGIDAATAQLSINLNDLVNEATFDPAADLVGVIDATDSASMKMLWSVIATGAAGSGITATNGVFSASASGTPSGQAHIITSGEVSAGYFTLAQSPIVETVIASESNGLVQMNKQIVGATGQTPDFDILSSNQFHFNNTGAATGLSEDLVENSVVTVYYSY